MNPCSSLDEVAARWDGSKSGEWFAWNDFSLRRASAKEARQARPASGRGHALPHHREARQAPAATSEQTVITILSLSALVSEGHGQGELRRFGLGQAMRKAETSSCLLPSPQSRANRHSGRRLGAATTLEALVAIDAEFVAVTQEETRACPRGKAIGSSPRLALGSLPCEATGPTRACRS